MQKEFFVIGLLSLATISSMRRLFLSLVTAAVGSHARRLAEISGAKNAGLD